MDEAITRLDMDIGKRYTVELGEVRGVDVVLVGCGGTGSFLALHLARLAYHLQAEDPDVSLHFVDPDHVEHKNVGRQNFAPVEAQIGANKAETLARRFGAAFGLQIFYTPEEFSRKCLPTRRLHRLRLVIGCVDNAAARRDIHDAIEADGENTTNKVWWLDCGNEENAGQVLIGNRHDLEKPEIDPMGFCSGLPAPCVQMPDLLSDDPIHLRPTGVACAEMTAAGVQSLMVNQAMAGWAAQYVYRLLVSRDLDVWGTWVDMESGSAKSAGIGGVPVEAGEIR